MITGEAVDWCLSGSRAGLVLMSFALERVEVKNSCSLKRTEPRWLQNALGAVCNTGSFPLASSREFWCSGTSHPLASLSCSWQWHSGRCVSVQFELCCHSGKTGFATRAKDCSHGEEQEEEQSQETPGSWISCSCSLFSPSLSSPCPHHSRAMGILFPPVGVTPPWLVPGAGFGHPQHCLEPATSEGNQTWNLLGRFYEAPLQHHWFQLFLFLFFNIYWVLLATQNPYLTKCVKHPKSRNVVFCWLQLWDALTHFPCPYQGSVQMWGNRK